jgi:TPR repeat protein
MPTFFSRLGRALGLGPAPLEPLEDGYAAYKAGDYIGALIRLRPHAERGLPDAQIALGIMYRDGLAHSQSNNTAIHWFERAKKAAERALVAGDDTEGARIFKLLAELGITTAPVFPVLVSAQGNLGHLYLRGKGVPQDYVEAVRWFTLAHKNDQYNDIVPRKEIGDLYYKGVGVKQDYVEAEYWYSRSRGQQAQLQLGIMYYKGEGVQKDYAEAYRYFSLAGGRYVDRTPAGKWRAEMASRMTPAQIAEGRRLARQSLKADRHFYRGDCDESLFDDPEELLLFLTTDNDMKFLGRGI